MLSKQRHWGSLNMYLPLNIFFLELPHWKPMRVCRFTIHQQLVHTKPGFLHQPTRQPVIPTPTPLLLILQHTRQLVSIIPSLILLVLVIKLHFLHPHPPLYSILAPPPTLCSILPPPPPPYSILRVNPEHLYSVNIQSGKSRLGRFRFDYRATIEFFLL